MPPVAPRAYLLNLVGACTEVFRCLQAAGEPEVLLGISPLRSVCSHHGQSWGAQAHGKVADQCLALSQEVIQKEIPHNRRKTLAI